MSRGICPRVNYQNSLGLLWIVPPTALLLLLFVANVVVVDAYSCHEVRTAFQLRQIGPLHRVPETPGTDVDLLVCKHQGPSCCTRKMEESYQYAVKRETLQNVRSYSFDLKYLLSGHADAFQDTFQYLLSFSQGHLSSLLEVSYTPLSRHALPHVNQLYASLSQHLRGANVSVEAAVHRFFDDLFPLAYARLINPGGAEDAAGNKNTADCLRMTRQDVNPFGPHPAAMARELQGALGAGRQLALALERGLEATNATEHVALSRECVRGLTKMAYCAHCRGLTLIKPCAGLCLNVLRGCLASVAELDAPWRRYAALLERLTHAVAGQHSLELALLGVRGHVNEALLYATLHGPLVTATVDKVCGLSTGEPVTTRPADPEVTTSWATSQPPTPPPSVPPAEQLLGQLAHLKSSLPLKPSKNDKLSSLRKISREFLKYLQRYKSFFAALPEMLCEGDAVEDATCWSGDDVVESYEGRIVGNGLQAQRQNPEVKVRSPNPTMAEVKERLERFNQETQDSFPGLSQSELWEELGSGETEEGSATDCDDEDGCQASGDGKDSTLDTEVSVSDRKAVGRQPGGGGDGAHDSPQRPPVVRVRGPNAGSPPSRPPCWSLAAPLALLALGMPWTLL